ncbi:MULTISPECIES: site-specific integrase [Aeromonas]|uniref:Site-specific integrase n=1 Tax=Aeromonas veronii TaxID=654 RepID=A0A4S5CGQ9_AERVE|nr:MULTISPECIES: site-specific integrase [Aeromonas]THJ43661.1 site-specific integrase [Aeromonas veronii]
MTIDLDKLKSFNPISIELPVEKPSTDVIELAPNRPIYQDRTERLLSECNSHYSMSLNINSMTIDDASVFAQYLNEVKRPSVAPRTWRAYRYSVTNTLGDIMSSLLISRSGVSLANLPKRNARKRSNNCNASRLRQLTDQMRQSNSRYRDIAILWLRAGVLTGLRPQEWLTSTIHYELGEPFLKVRTIVKGVIKNSDAMEVRYIPLQHLNSEDFAAVRMLCDAFSNLSQVQYQAMYSGCRNFINRASLACFGSDDSVSLYSTRQQFAANLKRSKINKLAIQYAMGHTNEDTQRHHYASAKNGDLIAFPAEQCIAINEQFMKVK